MDKHMTDSMDGKWIPATSVSSGTSVEAAPDVLCHTVQIVNICLVGNPHQPNNWVLVDAGMPESADDILEAAASRFGPQARPKAIILTHGHFDHVGAVVDLVKAWDVPVYAHERELPYLTGKRRYPDPDLSAGGGLIAWMSPLFPREPVDLGANVRPLPRDGHVPHLPGWKWIHTPGHTPGHISLFRERDRTLIAGDAFVTVRQESLYKVFMQDKEIHGPPKYFTSDWIAAKKSVETLESLKPAVAVTGHGVPMSGQELSEGLKHLVRNFDKIAVPLQKSSADDHKH
jgi:glyoxylase-like metal-dependent hydrolase (beta-lactamase superfamily II)